MKHLSKYITLTLITIALIVEISVLHTTDLSFLYIFYGVYKLITWL